MLNDRELTRKPQFHLCMSLRACILLIPHLDHFPVLKIILYLCLSQTFSFKSLCKTLDTSKETTRQSQYYNSQFSFCHFILGSQRCGLTAKAAASAFHMADSLRTGCSTSYPPPCCVPRKAVRKAQVLEALYPHGRCGRSSQRLASVRPSSSHCSYSWQQVEDCLFITLTSK